MRDSRARFSALVCAICCTFGYFLANEMVLRRPQYAVNKEAVVVCAATLLTYVLLYYFRLIPVRFQLIEFFWNITQRFSARRFLGVAVPAIASVLIIAGIPPDKAYASLVKFLQSGQMPNNIRQVASQEVAYLQRYKTFRNIAASDSGALRPGTATYDTSQKPAVIGQGIGKTVLIVSSDNHQGLFYTHPSPMLFSDFSAWSMGHDPHFPMPQFLIKTQGSTTDTVVNNVEVRGLAQDIANLTWTNVVFENCVISYDGGSLTLANVRFVNCKFEPSQTSSGQKLLDYIQSRDGNPINVYIP